jgi:hypothetical protein
MQQAELVKCEDCGAWEITADLNKGLCLLHPPTAYVIPTPQGPGTMTAFPMTTRKQGCFDRVYKSSLMQA